MTKAIFILLIISLMALWTNVNADEGWCAGWKAINGALRPPIRSCRPAPIQPKSSKEPNRQKMTGVIAAYDNGAELEVGSCWQTMILRVNRAGIKSVARYAVVRYLYDCMNRIPEQDLLERRQHTLIVVRKKECDQLLDNLLYFRGMNEAGGPDQFPLLKRVSGRQLEKIPGTYKLPCYLLRSGLQ